MTADALIDLMDQAAAQEPTSYTMSFALEMNIQIKQDGANLEMDMKMGMEMERLSDPEKQTAYDKNTTSVSMMGMNMDQITENYTLMEDGQLVQYTYMGMTDSWIRTELDEEQDSPWGDLSGDTTYEGATLDEEMQDLDGVEVYVLHCENIPEMGEGMKESMGDMAGFEDADAKFPCVVYVDTQTYLIHKIEVDMSAFSDILSKAMAESALGEMGAESKIESTMSNVEVRFGYETVEVPAVPQEAYDYLANAGKYTLTCGETVYNLVLPEGWSGESMGDTTVLGYSSDLSMMTYYMYLEGYSRDDLLEMVQSDVDGLKGSELYVSHGEGPAIEGYETMEVIGQGVRTFFAWAEQDGGYRIVYIMDYRVEDDPTELLQAMVNALTPASAE